MPEGLSRFLRHRGGLAGSVILLAVLVMALDAWWFEPVEPLRIVGQPELWPLENVDFPLGTDSLGRNILSIIIHGARATLLVGICASATATVIGALIGAVAGYYGGRTDDLLMRLTELFQTMPNLIFILTMVVILGSHFWILVLAIGLISWPPVARLTRAEFLSLRDREFVQACRSFGMGDWQIIFGEVLPNALPPIVVLASLIVAGAILFESAISFLGLGDPNVASWGRLVGEGKDYIRSSWYISAIPGIAIMITVFGLNLVGDALNDALNPKLRDR